MQSYERAIERLGSDDITATFGIAPPAEIVGPMNPENVYYGVAYGSDDGSVMTSYRIPLIFFEFNKYRPDLPPWNKVKEFVLATEDGGEIIEYTFVESHFRTTTTTGRMKTVHLSAEGPMEGVEGIIVKRDEVAEKRGIETTDSQQYKVNEELF